MWKVALNLPSWVRLVVTYSTRSAEVPVHRAESVATPTASPSSRPRYSSIGGSAATLAGSATATGPATSTLAPCANPGLDEPGTAPFPLVVWLVADPGGVFGLPLSAGMGCSGVSEIVTFDARSGVTTTLVAGSSTKPGIHVVTV